MQARLDRWFGFVAALTVGACDGSNVVGIRYDATLADADAAETSFDGGDDAADAASDRADAGGMDAPQDVVPEAACVAPAIDVPTGGFVDARDDAGTAAVTGLSASLSAPGFTCLALATGQARCVGDNNLGQLGDNTAMNRTRPVPVMGALSVREVVAGGAFACALGDDRTVRCWGANPFGQLGDGTMSDHRVAAPVTGLTDAAQVAVGQSHACALLQGGGARCWGSNMFGQLGDGTIGGAVQPTPTAVMGLTDARQLELGVNFSCALLAGGGVRCWGTNSLGQLGDGSNMSPAPRLRPCAASSAPSASPPGRATRAPCSAAGRATCWGVGLVGQLGNGANSNAPGAVPVLGLTDAVDLSAGAQHTCAVVRDGTVRCWGSNMFGQLGNGGMTASNTPVAVPGLAGAVRVSAGARHTCALLADGAARCWGANGAGQLGDGTTMDRASPVPLTL
jgi:alpha-tubulin suppressor-like RCC1 family protein